MIRLDITRQKAMVQSNALSKTQKAIKQQIISTIKSSPLNEVQTLEITIKDHPVERFLSKLFEMPEDIIQAGLKARFTRAYMENGKLMAKRTQFSDTFTADQLPDLKNGKNLSNKKDSFIYRLVERINEAIEE